MKRGLVIPTQLGTLLVSSVLIHTSTSHAQVQFGLHGRLRHALRGLAVSAASGGVNHDAVARTHGDSVLATQTDHPLVSRELQQVEAAAAGLASLHAEGLEGASLRQNADNQRLQ